MPFCNEEIQSQLLEEVVAEARRTPVSPVTAVFEPNKKTERRLEDAQQLPEHRLPTRYKCWQEPPEQVDAGDGKTLPIPYTVPSSSQQQHRAAR